MADLRDFTKKNPIFVGTDGIRLPTGNSTQRVASSNVAGTLRYNTDISGMEFYSPIGWVPVASPPSVSTVTPSTYSGVSGTEFTINGASFSPDAQVYFITSNGTTMLASTVTYVGNALLRATTPRAIKVEEEPISVRVNQSSGVVTKLDCIDAGGVPNWITTAGALGSIFGANTVNVYVSATDPEGSSISYQITSGSLPAGLSFSTANGLVQGVANSVTANTTYNFTIKANDTVNNNTDRSFSYTVLNRAPVINTAAGSLGTIYSGNAASASISAYDPDGGSLTYTVSSGTLPANSALGSANGVISGTPVIVTTNTTYSFTITSTDVGSLAASNNYTYTVLNRPPVWNTAATLTSYSPDTFTPITINAYDPDGGSTTYALTSGSVPSGLSFVTANATITGTPADVTDNTTSTFTVTATDVGEMGTARTFSLTITSPSDAQFANTVLSLNGNANTVVKDESTNNLPITVVGDAGAFNFSPYNTSWSANFESTSNTDAISFPSNAAYSIGTGNFTAEFWYNSSGFSGFNQRFFLMGVSGTTNLSIEGQSAGSLTVVFEGTTVITYSWAPSFGTWYHIAVCRVGSAVTLYINGVSVATATSSTSISNNIVNIGSLTWAGDFNTKGYLSNVRFSANTAFYTSNFTPSTTPLTSISGTAILTCHSNRFVDSVLNVTPTRTGTPSVSGFSPFEETDTTTGSMYFDGSGDYLTIPNDTAFSYNSIFSAELWYYSTHTSCTDVIPFSGNGNWDFIIPAATTVAFRWFVPGYGDTNAHTMLPNSWNHIAVSVSGGRLSFYLNGTRMYTNASVSFSLGGSDTSKIGYGSNSLMKGYISNVRVTRGSTPYDPTQTTITVPTSPLTAISGTTFLTLQNRQPHNNSGFIDTSRAKRLTTRFGNVTQGTFSPFSPTGWSNFFNGTSGLTAAANAGMGVTSGGNVTVELWMNTVTTATNEGLGDSGNSLFGTTDEAAWNSTSYGFIYNADGISLYNGNGGGILWTIATGVLHDGSWHHIAIVRNSGTWQVFVDGVSKGTTTTQGTRTLGNDTYRYGVGTVAPGGGSGSFKGYISNFRFTKSAVYTANFTPSYTPLTPIANTVLLTCQSNRILDNSNNATLFTKSGTPQVKAFSPFSPTSGYTVANTGGSAYFDGTDDRIQVGLGTDFNLGTSDFSMEFWYYATALGTYVSGLVCKRVGGVATGWGMTASGFVCDMGGTWYDSWSQPFWVGSAPNSGYNSATTNVKLNEWRHVLLTRQGTNARWFENGKLLGYKSRTGAIQQVTGSSLTIGLNGTTAEQPFIGYLSGGRICIGSVPTGYQTSSTTLDTQIFTPPTAPVTLTSQGALPNSVSMLMNFTDAAIKDTTSQNIIETHGNAKVNNSIYKTASGTLSFDGSGDYLRVMNNPSAFNFGKGNFTVEMWVYTFSKPSTYSWFVMHGDSASAGGSSWQFGLENTTLLMSMFGDAQDLRSTDTTWSFNVWRHVAFTRSGTTLRMFVNGAIVQTVTGYAGTLNTLTTPLYIGSGVGGDSACNGLIDDLRITKGVARYVDTFTAPTKSFAGK